MDQQTEQRLLNLADSLPPIEVRVPAVPEPEPVPEPESAKLLGQTTEGVPAMVPMAPVPDLPAVTAPQLPPETVPDAAAAAETVHDLVPAMSEFPWFAPQPVITPPPAPPAAAPPPHGRTQHVNHRQRTRHVNHRQLRLLLILGCVLVSLAVAGIVLAATTHSSSSGQPPAPAGTHSPASSHASPTGSHPVSSSLADVPGVPVPFAACVAFTASGNGTRSGNIYGIPASSGINVTGHSVLFQKTAFAALYKRYGAAPWKSYGCQA